MTKIKTKNLNTIVIRKLQHKMSHTKVLLSIVGIFALLILSTGVASALVFGTPTSDHPLDSLTPGSNASVTLKNEVEGDLLVELDFSEIGFATEEDLTVTLNDGTIVFSAGSATPFNLTDGETKTLTVSLDKVTGDFDFGNTPTAKLTATTLEGPTAEATLEYYQSFCNAGPIRHDILEIRNVQISNEGNSADSEDDEWFPFDDLEIEIEVRNNGDEDLSEDDLNDIIIEIGLLSSTGTNIINDFEFENSDEEEEEVGDMDPDDKEEFTFKLRLEESDEDFEGSFDFVVKAYEQGRQDETCVDFSDDLNNDQGFSESIKLDRETDEEKFVRFNDIIVNPTQVTCGDFVQVSADIVNVGDDKVENPIAILIDSELDLHIEESVGEDLSEGDQEDISFTFALPQGLDNRGYLLTLTSRYEVDDDPIVSDNEQSVLVNVIGCGFTDDPFIDDPSDDQQPLGGSTGDVAISASLASDARAGEELLVSTQLTNLGSSTLTVIVDATGFSSWADLNSISQRIVTIPAGQTQSVTLSFDVQEGVSGQQSFVIETTSNGMLDIQEVAVNIEEGAESGAGFDFSFGDNNLIWIVAIVNIVLIILIILVAVRLSRR